MLRRECILLDVWGDGEWEGYEGKFVFSIVKYFVDIFCWFVPAISVSQANQLIFVMANMSKNIGVIVFAVEIELT